MRYFFDLLSSVFLFHTGGHEFRSNVNVIWGCLCYLYSITLNISKLLKLFNAKANNRQVFIVYSISLCIMLML